MALKLQAEVGLDGSGFEAGLHRLEHGVQHVTGELKNLALTAFGVYGVEQAIGRTYERAKELVTESKRLGVGVEQLQLLRQAAKDSNTDLEAVAKAFEKIDTARTKALSGSHEGQKLMEEFKRLGITKTDLQSQTAGQFFMGQFRTQANKMNQEQLGPILRTIIGKGFGEIIPVLKTDFEELEKSMKKLGVFMDTETAVKVKFLGDEFELLSQIILSKLAPALIWTAETLYKFFGKLAAFSASAGAATNKMSWKEMVSFGLDMLNPTVDTKKLVKRLDMPAAAEAFSKTSKEWDDSLKAMHEKLADMARQLDHPKEPVFEAEPVISTKHPHPKALAAGDALVSVGNFLGSNRNPLMLLAERQLKVLHAIEHNTRVSGTRGATHPRMPHL